MATDLRKLDNVGSIEIKWFDANHFRFTIRGLTENGRPIGLSATIEFWRIPRLIVDLVEQWKYARAVRLHSINEIDRALPAAKETQ